MDSKKVAECHLDLLRNELYCDVVFIVGQRQERVLCHKLHLMARSPVFRAMFAERWKTGEEKEGIPVPDVEPPVFRNFLQFIYGDIFTDQVSEATDVLYVASKYQVTPLIELCEQLLKSKIELKNVVQIYQTASQFSLNLLKENAGDFMAKKFAKLISDPSFLLFMDEDTLVDLLPRDDVLILDELGLFDALLRWTRAKLGSQTPTASRQRQILKKMLPFVRFPLMKTQDFELKVRSSGILNSKECSAIVQYINSEPKARDELSAKLGFPCQPRSLRETDCAVEFYEAYQLGYRTLSSNNFVLVQNHIDTFQFSLSWKSQNGPNSNNLDSASLTSVVLRGPNYSSVRNKSGRHWNPSSKWVVSLKLEKYFPTDPDEDLPSVEHENIGLFDDRETEVKIDPHFELDVKSKYRISVDYAPNSFVHLTTMGQDSIQDHITSTRRISSWRPKNSKDIAELDVKMHNEVTLRSRDYSDSDEDYDDEEYEEDEIQRSSHCIRSVKLSVCSYLTK